MKSKIEAIAKDLSLGIMDSDKGLVVPKIYIERILKKYLQDTTEDVERICPHCGYATIPLKVNKPSEPYGKSLKDTTEEREDICLRCGVERKEVKKEGSNGCHSRGFNYSKHLWK